MTTALITKNTLKIKIMAQIELKAKDTDRMRRLNAQNSYELPQAAFRGLARKHRAARKAGDAYQMELIEYRLADINYHSECRLLAKGLYDEALAVEW